MIGKGPSGTTSLVAALSYVTLRWFSSYPWYKWDISIKLFSPCQSARFSRRKMRSYPNVRFLCSCNAEWLGPDTCSGLQGKGAVTISPCRGSPPHSQLSVGSSKLICQLIWQRLNFQSNQKTMYTVCFNWVKLRNGRSGLTLHKKVYGSHFGTNLVFKRNCITATSKEYPNATYSSPNSF